MILFGSRLCTLRHWVVVSLLSPEVAAPPLQLCSWAWPCALGSSILAHRLWGSGLTCKDWWDNLAPRGPGWEWHSLPSLNCLQSHCLLFWKENAYSKQRVLSSQPIEYQNSNSLPSFCPFLCLSQFSTFFIAALYFVLPKSELGSLDCHNKISQRKRFIQQRFIFPQIWGLEVQDQGVSRPVSHEDFPPVLQKSTFSLCLHGVFSLCIRRDRESEWALVSLPSSYKNTSPTEFKYHLYDLI